MRGRKKFGSRAASENAGTPASKWTTGVPVGRSVVQTAACSFRVAALPW